MRKLLWVALAALAASVVAARARVADSRRRARNWADETDTLD